MGRRPAISRRGRKAAPAAERAKYNMESIKKAMKWRSSENYKNLYNSMKKKYRDISENQCLELRDTESIRGWGVFAKKFIKKGQFITPYKGVILTKEQYEKKLKKSPSNCYLFNLPRDKTDGSSQAERLEDIRHKYFYAIDADPAVIARQQKKTDPTVTKPVIYHIGSEEIRIPARCPKVADVGLAAFVNHKCKPNCNCEFIIPTPEAEDPNEKIWLVSTRPIYKGQELTVDYNFDREPGTKVPENAITCDCGPECRHLDMTPFLANFYKK